MGLAPVHRLKKDDIIWLSRNRCKHSHTYLEHYNCYLNDNPDKCRVGYFDIESSNLKADMGFVIAWYILDEKGNYHGRTITKEELYKCTYPDQKLMKELIKELKNYDIIRTYFGSRFDIPFIRTRCVIQNLEFPFYGTLKHKDVYYTIKSKFSLVNKKLETACEMLLGDSNKTKWSVKHWVGAIQGKQKSLDYIDEHCRYDVLDLKRLTDKVIEFAYPINRSI